MFLKTALVQRTVHTQQIGDLPVRKTHRVFRVRQDALRKEACAAVVLLPQEAVEEGKGLDLVEEHAGVAAVCGCGEMDPLGVCDGDLEPLLFEDHLVARQTRWSGPSSSVSS